jgi:hypothetical protein
MRFVDFKDQQAMACLAMTREEAIQVVQDLVNQLAGAPGAGSKAHIVRSETNPEWDCRLTFMLDNKP